MFRPTSSVSLLVAFGTILFVQAAHAQEGERVRFSVVRGNGAEHCPDTLDMQTRVQSLLGRNPFTNTADAERSIEVFVQRAEGTLRYSFYVWTADGSLTAERSLQNATTGCTALATAAALAIAVAIDPEAALRTPEPTNTPSTPPPRPRTPRTRRTTGAVSLEFFANIGTLPSVAAGVSITGALQLHPLWSVRAALRWLPEQRIERASNYGFGLTYGALSGCISPQIHPMFLFDLCASAHAGALHAVVYGVQSIDPGDQWYLALGAQTRVGVRLFNAFRIEASLGIAVPLLRYRFEVRGPGTEIHSLSAIAGESTIGVGVDFR